MNEVTLSDHGFEFTLCSAVGYGRQAICYEAKDQNENVFFLKQLKNPTEENKRTFKRAYEVNQKLLKSPGSSFSTPFGYFEDESGPFVVMPKLAGNTLGKTHFKDLHELFHCILRLTKAINQSHEAGFLVIDLSPENVYVLSGGGMDGGGYLFDFDSMIPVEEIHSVSNISRSRMFAAPEARRGDCDQLCPATDYYTLAALLHMQLFEHAPNGALTDPLRYNYVTEPYSDLLKNNIRIQNALDDFFENCLAFYPEDRYQSYAELEAALVRLCDMTHANAVRPIQSNYQPYIPEHYVRQEKELELLKKHFAQRKNEFAMAIIHSEVSGAGKTTLAYAFAYEAQKQYDAVEFCYWEPEKGFKGVLEQIKVKNGYDPESAICLGTQRVLIIVDNYDQESSAALPCMGRSHLLFTSRFATKSFDAYIHNGTCIRVPVDCGKQLGTGVFKTVYHTLSGKDLSDEQWLVADSFLAKIEYHTYACDMIARVLADDFSAARSLEHIFAEEVSSFKDVQPGENIVEASVQSHIDALFRAQIEQITDDIGLEILFLMSIDKCWSKKLLCTLTGDNPDIIGRGKAKSKIKYLVSRNLVQEEGERHFVGYKGAAISVHSLVQRVLREKFDTDSRWDREKHIFRCLYNLYCVYQDEVRTDWLKWIVWPSGFKREVCDRKLEKFYELEESTFSGGNWMNYVALLDVVHNIHDVWTISRLKAYKDRYFAYLEGKKRVFFIYDGVCPRPFLVLSSIYPNEKIPDIKEVNFASMKGDVSIRLAKSNANDETWKSRELWELPDYICNNPVREILRIECAQKYALEMLRIPDGVWRIGRCRGFVRKVDLPGSLKVILPYSFYKRQIKELYIPASTELICESAFQECEFLERVTIAASKIRLEDACFYGCDNLREVELLEAEVEADENVFCECNNLEQFLAPKTWKERNHNILARLPAYQPEDDQETRIIIPIRKEYIKSITRENESDALTYLGQIWGDEIIDEIIAEELEWLAAIPRTKEGMIEVSDYLQNNPDFFDGFRMIFEDDAFNQIMSDEQREELINCLRKNWDLVILRGEFPGIFDNCDDAQKENKQEDPDNFCVDMNEMLEFWGDDDSD